MELLPKSELTIERDKTDANYVIVGAYEHNGYRDYSKTRLRDLPNAIVSIEDLERFGIDSTEIVVTPEMVWAGIRAIRESGDIENPVEDVARELVEMVYRAMVRAS